MNGTEVGGVALPPGSGRALRDGERLTVGSLSFTTKFVPSRNVIGGPAMQRMAMRCVVLGLLSSAGAETAAQELSEELRSVVRIAV